MAIGESEHVTRSRGTITCAAEELRIHQVTEISKKKQNELYFEFFDFGIPNTKQRPQRLPQGRPATINNANKPINLTFL